MLGVRIVNRNVSPYVCRNGLLAAPRNRSGREASSFPACDLHVHGNAG